MKYHEKKVHELIAEFKALRKAQVALEFISYMGLAISVVLIFSVIALNYSAQAFDAQHTKALENLAYATQEEFLLASQVNEGYTRTFTLPTKIVGGSYELSNDNYSFTLLGEHTSISLDIPHSTGELKIGENTLQNNNGIISIN